MSDKPDYEDDVAAYLRWLRDTIIHVPAAYGIDGGDVDALTVIARNVDAAVEALEQSEQLHTEALPKFDWGKSALDANAITLLNGTPTKVRHALAGLKKQEN